MSWSCFSSSCTCVCTCDATRQPSSVARHVTVLRTPLAYRTSHAAANWAPIPVTNITVVRTSKAHKQAITRTRNALRPELFTFVRSQLSAQNYSYIPCSPQLQFNCIRITQHYHFKLLNVIQPLQTIRKIYIQSEVPFEKRNFRLPPRSRWKLRCLGLLRSE